MHYGSPLAVNLIPSLFSDFDGRRAHARGDGFAPRAARSQCAYPNSPARASEGLCRSRAGLDVSELGRALAGVAVRDVG